MLKKLFYIGLGFSIIAVKKSVSLIQEKREQYTADAQAEEAPEPVETADEAVVIVEDSVVVSEADDLTQITGIGPTYAKRLVEAGITTFAGLAETSPEELREVTKATGKSADPESWIAQAGSLT